ncbi:MAG: cytochrome C [Deltaproteobacteria bacterium RIFOXYD12_FULL_50_9]|nr:MAG: cytochrome C [Deltaproteobacteria bacterium RIFOXYD12_FULL_50_9]
MIRYILFPALLMLLTVMPARAADFDHATHLIKSETPACPSCHLPDAESIKPDSKVCLECHDQEFIDKVVFPGLKTHDLTWPMNHRNEVKAKTMDCAACHEQKFCLECHQAGFGDQAGKFSTSLINVHRSDFHVSHPLTARANPQLCISCHEMKYCSNCHERFAPADLAILSHRRGWSDLGGINAHGQFTADQCQNCHPHNSVLNETLLPSHNWSNVHAREARKNLMTCQACHPQGDVCMKCHSAVSGLQINPHPRDWDKIQTRISKASDGRVCRKCH